MRVVFETLEIYRFEKLNFMDNFSINYIRTKELEKS